MNLILTTDGCCINFLDNPRYGTGGWAAIIEDLGRRGEPMRRLDTLIGREDITTSVSMEIIAVIEGLKSLGWDYRINSITIESDLMLVRQWRRDWIKQRPLREQNNFVIKCLANSFLEQLNRFAERDCQIKVKHLHKLIITNTHKECHKLAYAQATVPNTQGEQVFDP